jgi:glycosyltransferase involved in cell wall biosynthesis
VRERDGSLRVPSIHGPMIEGLADAARRVTILAWERPDASTLAEDRVDYTIEPRDDIDVLFLGPRGTWRNALGRRRRVARAIADASRTWDVLCLRMPNRRMAAVASGSRCPRLVLIDGSNVLDESGHLRLPVLARLRRGIAVFVSERSARRIIRSAGLVFVNSALLEERHRPLSSHIHVLAWSLRHARFSFRPSDRLTTTANLLFAGRVGAAKGVFDAFEVFAALKRDALPHAHLHIVGDGDATGALRQAVAAAGLEASVTFHGWVPMGEELFTLFASMDVLLHLSYAESFPRVIWDVLAHGVLVVCTPVGGIPRTLSDEREALFVPVNDVRAAVEAVTRLSVDAELRRSLLATGYDRARETDVERVGSSMLDLMHQRWPELSR